jgi:hypothetical protein
LSHEKKSEFLDAELFAENIKNQSFGFEQVNKKIKIMEKKQNKRRQLGEGIPRHNGLDRCCIRAMETAWRESNSARLGADDATAAEQTGLVLRLPRVVLDKVRRTHSLASGQR